MPVAALLSGLSQPVPPVFRTSRLITTDGHVKRARIAIDCEWLAGIAAIGENPFVGELEFQRRDGPPLLTFRIFSLSASLRDGVGAHRVMLTAFITARELLRDALQSLKVDVPRAPDRICHVGVTDPAINSIFFRHYKALERLPSAPRHCKPTLNDYQRHFEAARALVPASVDEPAFLMQMQRLLACMKPFEASLANDALTYGSKAAGDNGATEMCDASLARQIRAFLLNQIDAVQGGMTKSSRLLARSLRRDIQGMYFNAREDGLELVLTHTVKAGARGGLGSSNAVRPERPRRSIQRCDGGLLA